MWTLRHDMLEEGPSRNAANDSKGTREYSSSKFRCEDGGRKYCEFTHVCNQVRRGMPDSAKGISPHMSLLIKNDCLKSCLK